MQKRQFKIYFNSKASIEMSTIFQFLLGGAAFFIFIFIVIPWMTGSNSDTWAFIGKGTFDYHMEKGDQLYVESEFADAIKQYDSAIKASKTSSDKKEKAYLMIALCSVEMGRISNAKKNFELILKEYNTILEIETKERINYVIEKLKEDYSDWNCCNFGELGDFYLKSECSDEGNNCNLVPGVMFN